MFCISSKTDSLAKHIHPGSIVSGAFYVESSPTDHIYFYRTDDMILPPNNHNKYSTKYVSYPCTPNQLILFKSNLNHSTGAQKEGKKIGGLIESSFIKSPIEMKNDENLVFLQMEKLYFIFE